MDAKSVERWITQDRMPHATTRAKVARTLGSDETYFWPALLGSEQSKNATNAELVQVWPSAGDVPGDVWRSLFDQAADQVDVLVYSGGFLIEAYDLVETIRAKSAAGTQLPHPGRRPAQRSRPGPRPRGRAAVARSTGRRSTLEYLAGVAALPGVQIRTHQTTLYASQYRFDDSMLVNNHAYGSWAAHSPMLHLRRVPGGQLFDHYDPAFDRVWATGEPVA